MSTYIVRYVTSRTCTVPVSYRTVQCIQHQQFSAPRRQAPVEAPQQHQAKAAGPERRDMPDTESESAVRSAGPAAAVSAHSGLIVALGIARIRVLHTERLPLSGKGFELIDFYG